MTKTKISGPAMFMYCVIAICIASSTLCFTLYYKNICTNYLVLLTGIVTFTIMYHFWVRIIMGNVSKLFKKHINYKQVFFKERKFEKGKSRSNHLINWLLFIISIFTIFATYDILFKD